MWWLTIFGCISSALASRHFYQHNQHYEAGHLGAFPSETFKTSSYIAPKPNLLSYPNSQQCGQDGLHTLLTLRGKDVPYPAPMILDSQGSLVWTDTQFNEPFNMDIQEYKGEPHLTFWSGAKVGGHGNGINYILNSSYHIIKTVKAGNSLEADLHEFNLLASSGTALLDAYFTRQVDLRQLKDGPEAGWIWESAFQEVNIDTGEILFDWRASDHVAITQTYSEPSVAEEESLIVEHPFDWFHINSIDKDNQGNYLVSSRHLHALFCINGITGDIIWQLGGKNNMFKDLTDPSAYPGSPSPTGITLQHHARWHNNYTSITVFNNGDNKDGEPSTAMWFDIDTVARTVCTRGVYASPSKAFGLFQGSTSILPNQNILVGYGSAGQWSEFSPDGKPICDIRFTPLKDFNGGIAESYRIFKGHWVGRPDTKPSVVIERDVVNPNMWMYISWMGATEVRNWRIEAKSGAHEEGAENAAVTVSTVPKDGFETAIDLSSLGLVADTPGQDTQPRVSAMSKRHANQNLHKQDVARGQGQKSFEFLRAVALDANDTVLGTSKWVDAGEPLLVAQSAWSIFASSLPFSSSIQTNSNERTHVIAVMVIAVMVVLVGLLPCFWFLVVWIRKRQRSGSATTVNYQPVPGTDKDIQEQELKLLA